MSIIIPVLNEQHSLPILLQDIKGCRAGVDFELECVVVDGGSNDATLEKCKDFDVHVVTSACGRGNQMADGAEYSSGEVLLFLHADSRIDSRHCVVAGSVLNNGIVAGGFNLCFDDNRFLLRVAGWVNRWRFAVTRVFYGDHGIFLSREMYRRCSGFPRIPIFEDVSFSKLLRKAGKLELFDPPMVTSARRFRKHGVIRTFLKMAWMHILFIAGVSPEYLARLYDGRTETKEKTQITSAVVSINR